MGITMKNPVPTIANVASLSRSEASGATVIFVELAS
jgi:hypothetical protein